jgi:hypothetical protein
VITTGRSTTIDNISRHQADIVFQDRGRVPRSCYPKAMIRLPVRGRYCRVLLAWTFLSSVWKLLLVRTEQANFGERVRAE